LTRRNGGVSLRVMRLEYRLEFTEVGVPRFSVEAQEGIGKLFTLATLILNVLDSRPKVEIVFHGLNREDPERRITAFLEILRSVPSTAPLHFEHGEPGGIGESSSYYQWLTIRR
jgi:hypothetical protein